MSTRCTTHFIHGNDATPTAIIYRHSDGYPEGAGVDLYKFMDECGAIGDSRFSDPAYLAAKYVVFLADMFNNKYDFKTGAYVKCASKLQFLSVGVMAKDPTDIEFRYVVDCSKIVNGRPTLKGYAVSCDYETGKWSKREVKIPAPVAA